MDTFCIIFERIGNGLFAVFGLILSAVITSPSLTRMVENWEAKVKTKRILRLCIGISLGVFCLVYMAIQIRDGIVQVQENSPAYQETVFADQQAFSDQMKLKKSVKAFASRLSTFGGNMGHFTEIDAWTPLIEKWAQSLNDAGIYSTNLDSLLEDQREMSLNDPRQEEIIKAIAKELGKMADQLPNNDKNN